MYCKKILIMRNIILPFLLLLLLSCESDSKDFFFSFFPISSDAAIWNRDEFFVDKPVSIRLLSKFSANDPHDEGDFEPLNINTVHVCLDRELLFANDTIRRHTNLLDWDLAEVALYKVERSGSWKNDSYIIWINKNKKIDLKINNGYYTVYINATTKNNYHINDSTVIYLK